MREDPVQLCSGRMEGARILKLLKIETERERLLEEVKSSELREEKRLQLLLMVTDEREVNLA